MAAAGEWSAGVEENRIGVRVFLENETVDLTEVEFEGDGFPMIGEEELKRCVTSVLTVEKIEAVAMAVCDLGCIDKSCCLLLSSVW